MAEPDHIKSDRLVQMDQVLRFYEIIKRFIRATDHELSDRDLVLKVFERYKDYLADEPGDPNA